MDGLRRRSALVATAVLAAGLLVAPPVSGAQAAGDEPARPSDGMPNQAAADLASTDPGANPGQAGWGDLAGGVASRPYVRSLTVINGATATPVISNGTTTRPETTPGQVTAVVSPYNLCRAGQPVQGQCYATPNRVGLTVTYAGNGYDGYNFADPDPGVTVTPTVDAATVIDMTVALNSLGQRLRWSWVNGDLLYWQTSNLGRPDATVRIKFRPATAPYLAQWPQNTGCTATPIFNCDIASADDEVLTASMVFSLDNTLDPALTGAVFATQNAISGYLALPPAGTPGPPALDIQAASTHLTSNGSLQRGTLKAFLPAAALINVYGALPADADTAFTTTRTGDPGTNSAPVYTPWNAATSGSEGLLVTVSGITFSVPKYKVKGRLAATPTNAKLSGRTTTITATVPACAPKAPCTATVYDLGRPGTPRYSAGRTVVLANTPLRARAVALKAPSTRLKKGHRYLLVVRSTKTRKAVASTVGTVR